MAADERKQEQWAGSTYGSTRMHRWLIGLLRFIDVRLLYAFSALFVVPPTMVLNYQARNAIFRLYRHHMGYNWLQACWMTYKNHCRFAQVVIDKFAMYAGKKFDYTIDGYEAFQKRAEQAGSFVLLSSHIGNYEIAGYSLVSKQKRFNALVFGGEKESVMMNRNKLFQDNNIRMIPALPDMSHLFTINQAIGNGEILSMPADRIFGSSKSFTARFMGKEAHFPQGPFLLAAMHQLPLLFVSVMKIGIQNYHITVRELDSNLSGENLKQRAQGWVQQYADLLEETTRKYPTQWYNYFDFWTQS